METISVAAARKQESIGRTARLSGWIRTRRDSKGGFSFLELNDGSCQGNIQIVADGKLENYESEIKHLSAGSSISVDGEIKASQGKGQATEVVDRVVHLGQVGHARFGAGRQSQEDKDSGGNGAAVRRERHRPQDHLRR